MTEFVIPEDLAETAAGQGRADWLSELPGLVSRIAASWHLKLDRPFRPGGHNAWVAPAHDETEAEQLVLKVCWPHPEAAQEAEGLRTWGGAGAVQLYRAAACEQATVLLLERCRPGTQLRASPPMQHDGVVADLLRLLWVAPPPDHPFRPLSEMCDYWADRCEERSCSERGGLDPQLAALGISLLRELPRSAGTEVVLHTDLHAGNILAAAREPWLAIDPKPYVGDPSYDVTQHILNRVVDGADGRSVASRLAERLELNLDRVVLWLFARAVEASPYWRGMGDLARGLAPT